MQLSNVFRKKRVKLGEPIRKFLKENEVLQMFMPTYLKICQLKRFFFKYTSEYSKVKYKVMWNFHDTKIG